jgi:hypothetical protein
MNGSRGKPSRDPIEVSGAIAETIYLLIELQHDEANELRGITENLTPTEGAFHEI